MSEGRLTIAVWPVYVGLVETPSSDGDYPAHELLDNGSLHEPIDHMDYVRGQITWVTHPNGEVLGHARVHVPRGVYTHILFAHAPTEGFAGVSKMEHPIVFDSSGWVDINPIRNQDRLPRAAV